MLATLSKGLAAGVSAPSASCSRFHVTVHAQERYVERVRGNVAIRGVEQMIHDAVVKAIDAGEFFDYDQRNKPPSRAAMLSIPTAGATFAVLTEFTSRKPRVVTMLGRDMVVSYLARGTWKLRAGHALPATGRTVFDGLVKKQTQPDPFASQHQQHPAPAPAPAPRPPPAIALVPPPPKTVDEKTEAWVGLLAGGPVTEKQRAIAEAARLEETAAAAPPAPLHTDRYNREHSEARRQWVREWFADNPDGIQLAAQTACRAHFGMGVHKAELQVLQADGKKLRKTRDSGLKLAPAPAPALPAPVIGIAAAPLRAGEQVVMVADFSKPDVPVTFSPAPAPEAASGLDPLDELALACAAAIRKAKEAEAAVSAAAAQKAQADAGLDAACLAFERAEAAKFEAIRKLEAA